LDVEAFLVKTKVSFRLFEQPCVEVRSASNDDGSFSLRMQAECNFDCGRKLSLQENCQSHTCFEGNGMNKRVVIAFSRTASISDIGRGIDGYSGFRIASRRSRE